MNGTIQKLWAEVKANRDFIFVQTLSGNVIALPDPKGKSFFLSRVSPDNELGTSLLQALAASRMIDPEDEPGFFDVKGRAAEKYNEWVAATMARFSYKRKSDLFDRMKFCFVDVVEGVLTIYPSHRDRRGAWTSKGITKEHHVTLAYNSYPDAVGAALRLALERCKGKV